MSTPAFIAPQLFRPAVSPIVHPLDDFYSLAGLPLPRIDAVEGDQVPEPYKTLLVHNNDMTSTLEKFHGGRIHLRVLSRQERGDVYFREVVLLQDEDQPVEFGAIKINLSLFPAPVRRQILEERLPLGYILHANSIPHGSRPKAFLRVKSDQLISRALNLERNQLLYGRRNTLANPDQRPLAEIVEILPPLNPRE